MATYANRTCSKCGVRKPQPNMYQREVYVETAKSQSGISGATMFGVFAGDKKSGNQFRSWLFNSGQRTYKRKKTVWLCGVCAGVERPAKQVAVTASKRPEKWTDTTNKGTSEPTVSAAPTGKKSVLKWWLISLLVLSFMGSMVNDNNKKKAAQQTTTSQTSP